MKSKVGGLILLDKPSGITSFNALNSIKKKLDTRKVGHTGTLDKFASGLIVALSGKMTKLVPEFTGMDKEYEALIHFGEETETLDPEGEVVASSPIPDYTTIEEALKGFSGKISQKPPAYSAVHINGKRAYERVRSGEDVEMPSREVEIYNIDVLSWTPPYLKVLVHCSKGTYIRSLARDLGIAAGSRASLAALKRISVGPYRLNEAVEADSFSETENHIEPWCIFEQLTSVNRLIVDNELIPLIRDGKEAVFGKLKGQLSGSGEYALFDREKQMLAMIYSKEERLSYRFVC